MTDVILFDDVKINEIPSITRLIVLTDRYPIELKKHNGFLTWKARVIVLTSNYHPDTWWSHDPPVSVAAFMRRVTKCEHTV
jgi:hypothetical protein